MRQQIWQSYEGRILCNNCSYHDGGWHCITELVDLGYNRCECEEE
jgi:hypothetical protein